MPDPQARLDATLQWLAARLRATERYHGALNPAVANALQRMASTDPPARVAALVRASGYSHRHFDALFEQAVGLKPKAYMRVRRLQRALREADGQACPDWAGVAQTAGYADQPHLNRDFARLAGITPVQWQRMRSPERNHVPLPPGNQQRSDLSKTAHPI